VARRWNRPGPTIKTEHSATPAVKAIASGPGGHLRYARSDGRLRARSYSKLSHKRCGIPTRISASGTIAAAPGLDLVAHASARLLDGQACVFELRPAADQAEACALNATYARNVIRRGHMTPGTFSLVRFPGSVRNSAPPEGLRSRR